MAVDYALLSTTTSLGRVRGFTVDLVYRLANGPTRCCELVDMTGKSHDYVYMYLKRMRNYGLVENNEGFWFLTDIGESFLAYLYIVYSNINEYEQITNRKLTETEQKANTSHSKTSKQIPISLWLQNSGLDRVEREVVEVLVDHYNKTGSKFILVKNQFELSEKLRANPGEVLEALKNLRQDNIIYLYRSDIEGYWKIGLKTSFLKILESQDRNE